MWTHSWFHSTGVEGYYLTKLCFTADSGSLTHAFEACIFLWISVQCDAGEPLEQRIDLSLCCTDPVPVPCSNLRFVTSKVDTLALSPSLSPLCSLLTCCWIRSGKTNKQIKSGHVYYSITQCNVRICTRSADWGLERWHAIHKRTKKRLKDMC